MAEEIKENKKEYITELKSMNRKQMKALRKAELDPSFTKMDNQKTAELVDFILDTVYAGVEEIETAPYFRLLELAMDTYKLSMGGAEAVKN